MDRGQGGLGRALDLRVGRLLQRSDRSGSARPGRRAPSGSRSRRGGPGDERAVARSRRSPPAASLRASATRGSLSLASCASSAGSALASRVLNTSSAAARRFSGSGLASVSEPIEPSMALRIALLTRTFLKASALAIGCAGPGVEDRAGRRLVGDDVIGRVEQETIVAERVQDRGGLRRRFGREFADRLLGLGKLVVEKFRQRVVERVGARGAGEEAGRRRARGRSAPHASRPGQRIEKRASFRTPDLGDASGYGLAPTGQAARLRRRESITGWRGAAKAIEIRQARPSSAPSPTRGEGRGLLRVSRRTCRS